VDEQSEHAQRGSPGGRASRTPVRPVVGRPPLTPSAAGEEGQEPSSEEYRHLRIGIRTAGYGGRPHCSRGVGTLGPGPLDSASSAKRAEIGCTRGAFGRWSAAPESESYLSPGTSSGHFTACCQPVKGRSAFFDPAWLRGLLTSSRSSVRNLCAQARRLSTQGKGNQPLSTPSGCPGEE